jgi:hypothetical protein
MDRYAIQHRSDDALDEFVCITVKSKPGEDEEAFSSRLSHFWTHMLRDFQDEFEKVYAERTEFEESAGRLTRQYLAEVDVVGLLEKEFRAGQIEHEPIDADDLYSKYEAVAPEWMQIEH